MPKNKQSAFDEMPSTELVAETIKEAMNLIRSEVALAKVELKADVQSDIASAKSLGIAVVCSIVTVSLMAVAGALALALVMPGWAAALSVAGTVSVPSAVFGVLGWKSLKVPLSHTRKSLADDARWLKERNE